MSGLAARKNPASRGQRGGEVLICSDHHGRVRLPDARNASDNEFPELQIVVRVER